METTSTRTLQQQALAASLPGAKTEIVLSLFARGESFDAEGFAQFFTDASAYQFGNFAVETNHDGIARSSQDFFDGIAAVYHEIKTMWEVGETVFVEMDVAYWRPDGSQVTLPCCDLFRFEGDMIAELRIFMDAGPVFDASLGVGENASVYTMGDGATDAPPGIMRRFYAEHAEGRRRVEAGLPPRWSTDGPRWTIGG